MSDDATDGLRRLAEAATTGPWRKALNGYAWDIRGAGGTVATGRLGCIERESDADFLAAVDPPTVLGLLGEVDRLRAGIVAHREAIEDSQKHDYLNWGKAAAKVDRELWGLIGEDEG